MKRDREKLVQRFSRAAKDANPSLSHSQINSIEKEFRRALTEMPPIAIGLIGEAGVGKTTTINSLFNVDLEVGHAVAGTKEPRWIDVDLGERGHIRVLDMPGLGESIQADRHYTEFYFEQLPQLDVVAWVIAAEHRAMRPIQEALVMLEDRLGEDFSDRLLIAMNKVDLIHPGPTHWQTHFNLPSSEQQNYLQQRVNAVTETIRWALPRWKGTVVSYSAERRWQLEYLLNAMLDATPKERAWLLSRQADVRDFMELVDPRIMRLVEERRRGEPFR